MKIEISNKLEIDDLPTDLEQAITARLTMPNPVYIENQKMGRWNGNTDHELFLYDRSSSGKLITPRGFVNQVISMAKQHGESVTWTDGTRALAPVTGPPPCSSSPPERRRY